MIETHLSEERLMVVTLNRPKVNAQIGVPCTSLRASPDSSKTTTSSVLIVQRANVFRQVSILWRYCLWMMPGKSLPDGIR